MVFKLQSGHNFVIDRQMTQAKTIYLPTLKGGDIINFLILSTFNIFRKIYQLDHLT